MKWRNPFCGWCGADVGNGHSIDCPINPKLKDNFKQLQEENARLRKALRSALRWVEEGGAAWNRIQAALSDAADDWPSRKLDEA